VTVIDTTGVIDYLPGWRAAGKVDRPLSEEKELCAPDVLAFEVLAALRRQVQRGVLPGERAQAALADLEDLPVRLHPSLPLRFRAWEHRDNLTAGDALCSGRAVGRAVCNRGRRARQGLLVRGRDRDRRDPARLLIYHRAR